MRRGSLGHLHRSTVHMGHFGGRRPKARPFGLPAAAGGRARGLVPLCSAILVLGALAVSGSPSDEFSMISLPLGFEISGGEKRTGVSKNGAFAFGFLGDRDKDEGFMVAIWYNFGNKSEKVPVWTVGGGIRVSENSTFRLSMDGSLMLFDNDPEGFPVWSSDTANLGVKTATLMDNGNLVLVGSDRRVIWESFGCPTDTLLPGQSLHFPHFLRAPSTSYVASYYSLTVNTTGDISLVWEDNVTYWSSELNAPNPAIEARLESNGLFGLFDAAGGIAWYRLSEDFRDPSITFRHLKIDIDGNLRIYSWDKASSMWKVGWQAVQNQCSVFGYCGLYSLCSYNSTGPACECLSEDPESHGCAKITDLGNCKGGVSMSVLKQTVLYSMYPPHDVETMLSSKACREYCLNDTSCYAATAMNDGSGLCIMKRSSFISGYSYSSVAATSFLKVCLVPLAASTAAANLHRDTQIPLTEDGSKSQLDKRKGFMVAITLVLLITAVVFITVEMFVFWFIVHRRKQLNKERRTPFCEEVQMNWCYSTLIRLSIEEVKALTRNFKTKLSPTVYKGILPNQVMVTAKVLRDAIACEKDFLMAVSTLGRTHHRNLVALKGFCFDSTHKILLYEYVTNGSLDQWLFQKRHNRGRDSWQQRLDMAIGVARSIAYLHLECKKCIPHGNLKAENVLIDENFVIKVTDYGLQNLSSGDRTSSSVETLPERDIYMFGIILLQIITGKRQVNAEKLLCLAYQVCQGGELNGFIDAHLEGRVERKGVERAIRLALWCMQDQPSCRPSIGEVVKVLEGALPLDVPPKFHSLPVIGNQTNEGE
ncbi:hypothetical protein Taro_030219 [Colocasia esculenta]|uniref:Receptor-like serine/threonine-protein kinase n=1 Tax=Colocasia esculenta TaxID=4460 RepID=A0A843VTH7_COLES|nr:hypothetical protein [Colocasia esculenta]